MSKEDSFKLLDAFFEKGGNFIDTSNNLFVVFYRVALALPHFFLFRSQDETSEEFLGEWMESRKNRDQIVLATKVSALAPDGFSSNMHIR